MLLGWVISQVHWHDYVVDHSGRSWAVVDIHDSQPREFTVQRGMLWWRQVKTAPQSEFAAAADTDQRIRQGFESSIRGIAPALLSLAVVGFGVSMVITATRWWLLLRLQSIHITIWETIRLTFLGQFFNSVVPGTVGGDLVKAYYVSKHTPRKAAVLVSVFVDRALGLTELALLATIMLSVVLALGLESFDRVRLPAISLAVVLAAVVLTFAFLFSRRFRSVFHLQKIYSRLPIAPQIAAAGDAARIYRRRMGKLCQAILITFGAHVVWVGSIALIGASLGLATAWYHYFVYVPLVYILGAVPLTPGGVGLVENFYLQFFRGPLASASSILALALLARLIPFLWALPGIIVYITGPKLPSAKVMEAELGLETQPESEDLPAPPMKASPEADGVAKPGA